MAQHLANKLGVSVIAPSDTLWIREDGALIIGPRQDRNTGSWIPFSPAKSSTRYTESREATTPERAIDRYRAQRDGDSSREEDSASHQAESRAEHQDHATETKRAERDSAAINLGTKGAGRIDEVEDLVLDSELQITTGVQIGDPLFGAALSRTLSEARKVSARRSEVEVLQKQLRALQSRMLDVLRNPSLTAQLRRNDLLEIVNETSELFGAHSDVLHGFDINTNVGKARVAVATVDASFDRKMTLDDKGTLRRGRDPMGTFRTLVDRVVATNRALAEANVPRELVIAISETSTSVREVLVLDRARPRTSVARQQGAERLPVQEGADPNAAIVDIGTGESSFGIDLLDPRDRDGGPLVQTEYGPSAFDGSRLRSDLTWENAVPRSDANSAIVFGDPLQTMDLMFGEHGVKRVFINNVNAHYDASKYEKLANVLAKTMVPNGRVEIQWTNSAEYPGGAVGDRGHITGPELQAALDKVTAATGRRITHEIMAPETKYDYSIEPSRRKGGPDGSKKAPAAPVPEARWIFTFH